MEVSITKALAEVKKIAKRINNLDLTGMGGVYKVKDQEMINKTKEEFKSTMQSMHDLFSRRSAIKSAIAKANVITEVEPGVTIYDLIVSKEFKHEERERLLGVRARVLKLEDMKMKEDAKLDSVINQVIEKAYGSTKPAASFVEDITKSHYDVNGSIVASTYTSEEITNMITKLDDEIVELDIKLSEINSKVTITIPD